MVWDHETAGSSPAGQINTLLVQGLNLVQRLNLMNTIQMILLGIKIFKALEEKDPALGKSISMAIADELDGTDEDKEVVLSFRRQGICEENIQIEVTSLNLEGGGDFTVSLPAGQYRVVASTDTSTLSEDVEVVAGEDTYLVIEFPVALDPINQG